jgi:phosphatidate cytidylyltransferase
LSANASSGDPAGTAHGPPAALDPAANASVAPGPAHASTPAPKGSAWGLRLRIASGVLFVPLLILLARSGGIAFLGFVGLEVFLASREFYRMMRGHGLAPYGIFGTLSSFGLLWVAYAPQSVRMDFLVTALLLLILAFGLRHHQRPRLIESIAVTLLGVLYVGWLSSHLVMLRELPWRAGTSYSDGASFVLLAFFVTWSCDTAAYLLGRTLGRTRPWTKISPRKTIEGSLAGFTAAVAAAFVARAWFAPYLGRVDAVAIGVLVGIFAQVGDLVESLLKRETRHGDSSDLIPGHGGVLDRFDSLYFGAPVIFYYLKIAVFQVP